MTEDEARTLNCMSARIAALQFLTTWLLYKSLKEEDDPQEMVAALLAKARGAADRVGPEDVIGPMFVEEVSLVLEESRKLLG